MSAYRDRIHHSYSNDDVELLLTPVEIQTTDVEQKEALIQSGEAHYSEMISEERRPDDRYMRLYAQAMSQYGVRIGEDIARIALRIQSDIAQGVITPSVSLCSLIRAGLPYGVLLRRALVRLGVDVEHFGVSIIRDRGIDEAAIRHVQSKRPQSDILFVDGWTGKGAIAHELERSAEPIMDEQPRLVVLADPSGSAWLSGSGEDWLIPSGILGANVSGLISRSILNDEVQQKGGFHGAMRVSSLEDIDQSVHFIEEITNYLYEALTTVSPISRSDREVRDRQRQTTECIETIRKTYQVDTINRIKPGIAEATRAVLRRQPERVFISDPNDSDLAALIHLCRRDGVHQVINADLTGPFKAITLIGKVG